MKYELTKKDLENIEERLKEDDITYLKKIRLQRFNVGDILIKKSIYIDDKKNQKEDVETYPYSTLPIRYLIVHADYENHLFFYKEIGIDGKLDPDIRTTFDFDDCGYDEFTTFEVDPYMVDAVILDTTFDVREVLQEERDRREDIKRKNLDNSILIHNLKDANKFLKSLNKGDKFYFHTNSGKDAYMQEHYSEGVIKHTKKMNLKSFKTSKRYLKNKVAAYLLNDKYISYFTSYGGLFSTVDLIGNRVYKQKPLSLEPIRL